MVVQEAGAVERTSASEVVSGWLMHSGHRFLNPCVKTRQRTANDIVSQNQNKSTSEKTKTNEGPRGSPCFAVREPLHEDTMMLKNKLA